MEAAGQKLMLFVKNVKCIYALLRIEIVFIVFTYDKCLQEFFLFYHMLLICRQFWKHIFVKDHELFVSLQRDNLQKN